MAGDELIHFKVTGTVQGVFFRQTTQKEAKRLGLKGWVKNQPDESVEGVAVGPSDKVSQFESYLGKGPSQAEVQNVEIKKREKDVSEGSIKDLIGDSSSFEVR